MERINVKKETVLDILKKNLVQHQKDYDEAVLGWIEKTKSEWKTSFLTNTTMYKNKTNL